LVLRAGWWNTKWIRSQTFGGKSICDSTLDQVLYLVSWIFVVFVKGDKHLFKEILWILSGNEWNMPDKEEESAG